MCRNIFYLSVYVCTRERTLTCAFLNKASWFHIHSCSSSWCGTRHVLVHSQMMYAVNRLKSSSNWLFFAYNYIIKSYQPIVHFVLHVLPHFLYTLALFSVILFDSISKFYRSFFFPNIKYKIYISWIKKILTSASFLCSAFCHGNCGCHLH